MIDEDVVKMRELRVCGCLPGVEVGGDGPALRTVCGLGEHQGASVQEQDVPGIDGGEALSRPELDGAESGGKRLKVSASEVINVVVARGPDAS